MSQQFGKYFVQLISTLVYRKEKTTYQQVDKEHGVMIGDNTIANEFNKYFTSIGNQPANYWKISERKHLKGNLYQRHILTFLKHLIP